MPARRRIAARLRIGPGTGAIVALAISWGVIMHAAGWGQLANYAQVRAFADGQTEIDRWHWETKDKAWVDGHFYSVKAPGLATLTLPAYLALDAAGAKEVAADGAANARATVHPHWAEREDSPWVEHGFSPSIAVSTGISVERQTPIIWALTLLGAVLPAICLLFLVRSLADRIEPGYGTAAAITLGLGTIVLTFASEYFPHVIAATLAFAAFAVLFRERRGPPRTRLVAGAGLLAGLAVTFEYPLGLAGAVLFFYALSRSARRLPRAAVYAGAAFLGAVPALAFNWWALGSPFQFAYADAVAVQGYSGHAALGLNDDGFFGISAPNLESAFELLVASRGLLTLTPIVVIGLAGIFLIGKRGFRAEAAVIGAICAAYFVYNAGYWLPFGGGSPGPRFLIPALPFLALGFASAWRRWPALTIALAIPSVLYMVSASLTEPLLGEGGTGEWAERLRDGDLEHTLLTTLGVEQGWLAVAPVLVAVGAAIALAAAATPKLRLGDLRLPIAAVCAWVGVAVLGPTWAGDSTTPLDGAEPTLWLVGAGAFGAAVALLVLRYRERRSEAAAGPMVVPQPALAEPPAFSEEIS